MSGFRPLLLAGLVALTMGRPAVQAQSPYARPGTIPFPVNPNQYVAPNQTARQLAYNTAVLGQGLSQVPPYAYGVNPYVGQSYTAPTVVPVPHPTYTTGSPYSLSTAPGGGGYTVYGGGGYGGWGGWGWGGVGMLGAGPGIGYGQTLQGMASLTSATGQYWKDIQSARITREQSRQAAIETKRQQLQWELEYEKYRPTAPKMLDAQRAADLDWARKDPPSTEIWSGRTLNTLLKSIFNAPAPTQGPNISLESNILKGLNLTDKTTRASLSLAKDEGRIDWTESLQEAPFDDVRDRFSRNFDQAIRTSHSGEMPSRTLLRDLRSDLKSLESKLDDMVRDLPPSRYIESRRLLNRLNDTVKGLSDPRLCKACNRNWRNDVHSVAELVNYCLKNGLEFGPAAAPGDEPSYTAAYYALRAYERGVVGTQTVSTSGN